MNTPRSSRPVVLFSLIQICAFAASVHSAHAQTYDAIPVPYCNISYDVPSSYSNLETEVTGSNPAGKDMAQFVLEAFAQANVNNSLLDGTSESTVVTALSRLESMWVPASLNFKTNYTDSGVSDTNQVDFVTESLGQIASRYPKLLAQYRAPTLSGTIENMLVTLLNDGNSGALAQNITDGLSYTNIWLMNTACIILTSQGVSDGNGQLIESNTNSLNIARTHLMDWISAVQAQGVHEFMSPTYTGVQMQVAGDIEEFATDPSLAAMGSQAYKLLWIDMYANWYNQNQRIGGTHSRTYDFLTDTDHSTDRFYYAASNPTTSSGFDFPDLMQVRTPSYWIGQDYISYILPPPVDVPDLFSNPTLPSNGTRTLLRNYTDGSSDYEYAENYMANPAGSSTNYPFCVSTAGWWYNDVTFEGFTIDMPGGSTDLNVDDRTTNVNYNMQARGDYYLQQTIGGKSITAQPFIASVQRGPEALFLAASSGTIRSDSPTYTETQLASTIIFPNTAQVWIGNSSTAQKINAGQSVPINSGTTIFLRMSNSGQSDGLVTGIRFLLSTNMSGTATGLSIVDDGTSQNAMRVTCVHSSTKPTSGYGVMAFWTRTVYCSDTTSNFNAFRTGMTSASVTATENFTTGTCTLSVPGLSGTAMSITANASAQSISNLAGGDLQADSEAPLLQVNGTEFVPSTVQSWTAQNIGTATGGTATALTSGTLYTGQIQVVGGGSDIWGSADAFEYCYQTLVGDGTIIGQLTSVTSGTTIQSLAKAGLMMRNDLTAGSPYALVSFDADTGQRFQTRTTEGGSSTRYGTNTITTIPYWFMLTRVGNVFTGYSSTDGMTWTEVASPETISMNTTLYVGMAVTSRSNSQLLTTVFDNVGILQQP